MYRKVSGSNVDLREDSSYWVDKTLGKKHEFRRVKKDLRNKNKGGKVVSKIGVRV